MNVLLIVFSLVFGYAVWCFADFFSNYSKARTAGLPIVVTPVNTDNIFWIIFAVPLRPFLRKWLPESLMFPIELSTYGFECRLGSKIHEKLGPSWILVGPGTLELWTADPELTKMMATKHKDFPSGKLATKVMGLFGPNVIASEGEHWQRQRRIVAPTLNEKISRSVWDESLEQAEEMANHLMKVSAPPSQLPAGVKETTDSTIEGLRRIAINVLGAVSYGKPQGWIEQKEDVPEGHQIGYLESLFVIVDNLVASVFIPPALLCLPVFPRAVRKIGVAVREFPRYTKEIVAEERKSSSMNSNNLMSQMVKLSDESKRSGPVASRQYLTEEEITGNLFQFTVAGYDTTANTMAYAIAYLACMPDLQDWVVEQIDEVMSQEVAEDYSVAYPKLTRCLALMFEVLRLHTPVCHLARRCDFPQRLQRSNGIVHQIPACPKVYLSVAIMHVTPGLYGSDPLAFQPSRWYNEDGKTLKEPAESLMLAWSFGPRTCPGMKMAQVEFVATFATILKRCRIEPVVFEGETMEQARDRLSEVMKDSLPLVTLQMNRPKDMKLRWIKR